MFINNGREGFTVLGNETGVARCVEMIKDSLNEVEETVKLSKDEVRALLAHNGKYRRMVETACHVNTRLADSESIRVMGGERSVRQAEHTIRDLFKSRGEWRE